MKHEEKKFECPMASYACPFNNKQLLHKIELGQMEPKEFMDEMMETVLSDLSMPSKNKQSKKCQKSPLTHPRLITCMFSVFLVVQSSVFSF